MKRNYIKKITASLIVVYYLFFLTIPVFCKQIILPSGTTIQLELMDTVSSESATVGQKVSLKVTNSIKINRYQLIKGGSIAVGEVQSVQSSSSFGSPGSIGIQIKNVRAVDGSVVPLSATKLITGKSKQTEAILVTLILCIFGVFIKGENADLQAGTIIEATTLSDEYIDINLLENDQSKYKQDKDFTDNTDQLLESVFDSNENSNMIKIEQVKGKYILIYINNKTIEINDTYKIVRLNSVDYEIIGTAKVFKTSGNKAVLEIKLNNRKDIINTDDRVKYK